MNKTIAWTGLIVLTGLLLAISACMPFALSDAGNSFLKSFVGADLLSLLGVVVTISLASAGNLHLELNRLQDRTGSPFSNARAAVKMSAYSLIGILGLAGALVLCKPLAGDDMNLTAAFNSLAIVLMVFSLSVLIDLTRTTFRIPASSTLPENK